MNFIHSLVTTPRKSSRGPLRWVLSTRCSAAELPRDRSIIAPTEPAGRFLLALAVIGLFVMGGLALRQRPRLAVIEDAGTKSIAVQRLRARHEFTREQIDRVRLVRYPRLGRRVPMLEIDIVDRPTDTEKLLIFGRWDLGTSPEDVLDVLAVHGLVPPEK